jgi:GT2 family glycosyltransferase
MTPPPLVTALILNYRSGKSAIACAKALSAESFATQMEIIIIDNHSNNDSIAILRAGVQNMNNVRIVETPKNKGFGYGYNLGARCARGTYLLINNPDKRIESGGLQTMINVLERDANIGILGPKLMHPDGTRRLSYRRDPRMIDILSRRSFAQNIFGQALTHYLMLDTNPEKTQDVDWIIGGCFLIRRDFFQALSGFDERFFLFFEDADLCRRCREAGKKVIYFPKVQAMDRPRRLSGETFLDLIMNKVGRIHICSAVQYFWKWSAHRS